ncbi:xanthine dehydrogenase family protein molybdopterin-binding subunit [Ketobacter sp. MCCC 1A13808]|uniref:aldehyde oxidoreductase molybdenum-binding subunit PaoC n=1 Tax=Ketobacter sp. MCCC 1A13808 TaxID=2602738 RepID=UPI0012EB49E6|nr:aldehyde oxidoreductase molybdenum-binding subunit PaoC [Ketobacter sp. MCCC 1A13808]MVF13583.1 xanthine dehydrogenase family protein molybdopterin-binding subunit [Ketobacter sp. MCCC 1A13808]
MKFDKPATTNPIDQLSVVGKSTDRIDGPMKTTGTATYAYEHKDLPGKPAYGYILGAAIAKGRIESINLSDAKSASGVRAVVHYQNCGQLGQGDKNTATLLGGPEIEHYHQAIALVVADTFEQARSAAELIDVTYKTEKGAYDLAEIKDSGANVGDGFWGESDTRIGDFDNAFSSAPVKLDQTYTTPDQSHAMMEPHASIAAWQDEKLTLWTSTQMVDWAQKDVAKTLRVPTANVTINSPYVGGGFGGKLFVRADAIMAALGAKAAGVPVKVFLQRPLIFNNTTHRPATIQRLRMGADRSGNILAIGHESWSGNLKDGSPETAVSQTRLLYRGEHRMTQMRLTELNLPEGNAMRAPGEAVGLMALEIAIDELAEKLDMDPIDFRILNDTQVDPEKPERPFSQRQLVQCMQTGAKRFNWHKRNPKPAQIRDGRWRLGMGMAAAIRGAPVENSGARVRLETDATITVETDMTDIGTGTYTILAQTAAEMMGVSLDKVTVKLGASALPVSCGSGGQWGANSSTAGVYAACVKLREKIAVKLGFNPDEVVFSTSLVTAEGRSLPLQAAAIHQPIEAEDTIEFGDLDKQYAIQTFGAHFVEVGVDTYTAEIRIRRMLAVCAAGRILNPKSARSQVIGGMTMSAGAALMEELSVDTGRGYFVNHDLAEYQVPVHADIPHQEVLFLEETDPMSSPMKAKGVGELGICGVGAAIANAIYNATGVRVRDYPITLDKLLTAIPDAG